MLEKYYKRSILYDYCFSLLVVLALYLLIDNNILIKQPDLCKSFDFSSDIGTVGLTVSGFILTLLTILMTLKSGQLVNEEELSQKSSPFKIFLASQLYMRSIEILRNGVLSLVTICFLIFFLKMLFQDQIKEDLFYINVIGLFIIITTFLRCFYVLNLILRMQKKVS